jgi:RNA recognition motif-containing protein
MLSGQCCAGSPVILLGLLALFALGGFIIGIIVGRDSMRPRKAKANRRDTRDTRDAGDAGDDGDSVEMYVGNLAYELEDRDLFKAFGEYGKVISVRIIKHKLSGKSKGYGFITMANLEVADAARKAINGKELKGRKVVVSQAKSRAR